MSLRAAPFQQAFTRRRAFPRVQERSGRLFGAYIIGGVAMLAGLAGALFATAAYAQGRPWLAAAYALGAALAIAVGAGLWRQRAWAWLLGIGIAALTAAGSLVLALFQGFTAEIALRILANVLVVAYLWNVSDLFGRQATGDTAKTLV